MPFCPMPGRSAQGQKGRARKLHADRLKPRRRTTRRVYLLCASLDMRPSLDQQGGAGHTDQAVPGVPAEDFGGMGNGNERPTASRNTAPFAQRPASIALASPTHAMSAPFQTGGQPVPGFRVTGQVASFVFRRSRVFRIITGSSIRAMIRTPHRGSRNRFEEPLPSVSFTSASSHSSIRPEWPFRVQAV